MSKIRPSLDGATGLNPYNRSLSSRSCSLTSKQRTHKFLALLSPIGTLHLSRTLYKSALFMQNKANFRKSQMNVSIFSQKAYENISDWTLGKNKPNQTQSQDPTPKRVGRTKEWPDEAQLLARGTFSANAILVFGSQQIRNRNFGIHISSSEK